MVLNETEVVQSNRVKPRFYSLDDEVLLQSLLTTLTNLDFAYEQERERVSTSTKDANLRARVQSFATNIASKGSRTCSTSRYSESRSCRRRSAGERGS